jgi:hypothetical protein
VPDMSPQYTPPRRDAASVIRRPVVAR